MLEVLSKLIDRFKKHLVDSSLSLLKLRLAICYLEGVKSAHRLLILLCVVVGMITLLGAGLMLVPLVVLLYTPWEPTTKAIVGVSIGAIYLLAPVIVLTILLSERRWMRMTGATALLRKLVD